MSDRLNIRNEMREFDLKRRDFYSSLTDEERKKFSNYLMIRWGATVRGSQDMEEFYVISANERLNKHFFAVNRHPQLQWLMCTSVSPGLGAQDHTYLKFQKKQAADSSPKKMLMDLYPTAKAADIEAMAQLTNRSELKELLRDHGNVDNK
jgi:hypothetical protein